jgi:excisionase family DNA binding protein
MRSRMLDSLPDWITPGEVAELLRLGRSTTYSLIRSGAIASRRFGRRILVAKQALVWDGQSTDLDKTRHSVNTRRRG